MAAPLCSRKFTARVAFNVQLSALLQLSTDLFIAAGINNGIHIHMAGKIRCELGTIAGQDVYHSRGQITRRDDFGKCECGQRIGG